MKRLSDSSLKVSLSDTSAIHCSLVTVCLMCIWSISLVPVIIQGHSRFMQIYYVTNPFRLLAGVHLKYLKYLILLMPTVMSPWKNVWKQSIIFQAVSLDIKTTHKHIFVGT